MSPFLYLSSHLVRASLQDSVQDGHEESGGFARTGLGASHEVPEKEKREEDTLAKAKGCKLEL